MIENARTSGRHGKALNLSEEGAVGRLTPKELWIGWAWILGPCAIVGLAWWLA